MQDNKQVQVLGEITAKFYDQSNLKKWQKYINRAIIKLRSAFPDLMKYYQLGDLQATDFRRNVICKDGFNAITKRLAGDTTYTCEINKAILGTGSGTVSSDDSTLFTEAYRNDMASGSDDENIAYLTAFFTESEVSGAFTEFGNCIDGLVDVDTGKLWSHIAGLNWVKDLNTVIVVSCKYTFASA